MRRNFLIGVLAAILTFVALSGFLGRHRGRGWHRGWRHSHCYYDSRYHDRAGHRHTPPQAPADSLSRNY